MKRVEIIGQLSFEVMQGCTKVVKGQAIKKNFFELAITNVMQS